MTLRICQVCGFIAHTEEDLKLFMKRKTSLYGRQNLCKKCHNKKDKERRYRTTEFIEIFQERSPDGLIWCHFCEEEIKKLSGRHKDSLSIHSLDGDHENWKPENKVPVHGNCHSRYHQTGERNYRWLGDEANDNAKRNRRYRRGEHVAVSRNAVNDPRSRVTT